MSQHGPAPLTPEERAEAEQLIREGICARLDEAGAALAAAQAAVKDLGDQLAAFDASRTVSVNVGFSVYVRVVEASHKLGSDAVMRGGSADAFRAARRGEQLVARWLREAGNPYVPTTEGTGG